MNWSRKRSQTQLKMNADTIARWLKLRGYRVLQTESSYWYSAGFGFLQAFPSHWQIQPSHKEISELIHHHRSTGLRYTAPENSNDGSLSYHIICADSDYNLSDLTRNARCHVKRGFEIATYGPVGFLELANEGWIARYETLRRQRRVGVETNKWWRNLCESAIGLQGFEAWGARIGTRLVASIISVRCDDCCLFLYQQSTDHALKLRINHALTYSYTKDVLRERSSWINYGHHSLDAPMSVDEYKLRMGFRIKPVRQRVFFHPLIRSFISPKSYTLIDGISSIANRSSLSKFSGLCRLYLNGTVHGTMQSIPELMLQHPNAIIRSM